MAIPYQTARFESGSINFCNGNFEPNCQILIPTNIISGYIVCTMFALHEHRLWLPLHSHVICIMEAIQMKGIACSSSNLDHSMVYSRL